MSTYDASCLCGACKMTVQTDPNPEAGACHCGKCRKWSGGIFLAVECSKPVIFNDNAPIGVYGSSEWGERVFCRICGSSLVWRSLDGAHSAVALQAFDDPESIPVTTEIFTDCKPGNYALSGQLRGMTEAEFMAQFTPQQEG
ncbi:GFA family protein [Paracoccus homiensis]|uniref:GFA family protein n=1 Tax=Paracoccus homiensis TaxID=364199 RepID=UPI00398D3BF9